MDTSPVPRRRLSVVKTKTLDEYVREWHSVDSRLQSSLWELAKIAASLSSTYGQSEVEKFASRVGRSPQYVFQVAQVHREFGNSPRVDNLTFTHYRTAVRSKNPKEAIRIASEEKMSTRDLETWIEGTERPKKRKGKKRASWGRGATTEHWEGLDQRFLNFTDEQLIIYALCVCSRVSRSLHLESVEFVTGVKDASVYVEERKGQLKFQEAA